MSHEFESKLGPAIESSAAVAALRRFTAGSVVCAQAASAARRLRRVRERVIAGLGGEWTAARETRSTAQVQALAAESRFVAGLSAVVLAPFAAWQASGVRRAVEPIFSLDLAVRVRLIGWVTVITVVTHAAVLAALGTRLGVVGGIVSAGLVAAGLAAMWRPGALASAWNDRLTRRERSSRGI